uniref:Rubrerythrin n=1 Tax=Candidatus Kentrum sp. MB TaxID=2138164 RepID=A0A450XXX7_9GAMM|nr:MAG: Rubrerythrin [Candidatus Kentron sp. MB]VFK34149.1 MAG: Rubrerythrin [Candidatus Kentron sp. MB]VFK76592.1 MAG: Rubrerythrin [Candidatus Kentron sp. MB]
MELKGSKTEQSLKDAFAVESQANQRYLYFAKKADVEGYPDVANIFRFMAENETGQSAGHLDYLSTVGDPITGLPMGATENNLKASVAGETNQMDVYSRIAKLASEEGFEEIAEWFQTLVRAKRSHAGKFQRTLEDL